MERRFRLCEEDCIAVEDGELNIFFTYELMPKTIKQDALIKDAEAKIISLFEKENMPTLRSWSMKRCQQKRIRNALC